MQGTTLVMERVRENCKLLLVYWSTVGIPGEVSVGRWSEVRVLGVGVGIYTAFGHLRYFESPTH